jgi:hypothetical protein
MRTVRSIAVALAIVAGAPAEARNAVPVQQFLDQRVVTQSGRTPSLEEVRQGTVKAAMAAGWALAKTAENQFEGTKVVRGKHTIVVSIWFAPDRYSVTYKSSDNMKYGVGPGGIQVIHPNYNVWARQLVDAIRVQVSSL